MKIDKTLSDSPFVPRVQCGAGKRFENVGYVSVCGTLGSTSHEGGVETRTLAREIMRPFSEFLSAATRPWLGGWDGQSAAWQGFITQCQTFEGL